MELGSSQCCVLILFLVYCTGVCVNFTRTAIRVREDDEYAEVCVELEGELDDLLSVYLFTIPGTALGKNTSCFIV